MALQNLQYRKKQEANVPQTSGYFVRNLDYFHKKAVFKR